MAYTIDFSLANSSQVEIALCKRIEQIRLSRNITQARLAKEAGVALRTIGRLEKGDGVSFDTFIRVMVALRLQNNLEALLPDPTIRPVERLSSGGHERKRARPGSSVAEGHPWTWGDQQVDGEK